MLFKWVVFNTLFLFFSCEALNTDLLACKLALNPFATFQPSKISQGDIETISKAPELNYGSRKEMFQFLKKLKYAKVSAAGIALSGVVLICYGREWLFFVIPFMMVPTAAYLSQLNQFEKDMKAETKILGIKAYYRP